MPPRVPPKTYILLLKTHRLTVFLSAPQNATVGSLKAEALSALSSPVLREPTDSDRIPTAPGEDEEMLDVDGSGNANANEDIPVVTSVDDFELCRAIRDRGRQSSAAPAYEVLDTDSPIRGLLNNWEELYVQFRDENGKLVPVEVSHTSLLDEEEEEQARRAPPPPQPTTPIGKGKRKAPPE
ncbi:hypothetical protein EDD15DRAFT_915169 [Pisolithus albus]|nr:hypothetical protein EDD15DRAFT_915169 [Pisolithus albus]